MKLCHLTGQLTEESMIYLKIVTDTETDPVVSKPECISTKGRQQLFWLSLEVDQKNKISTTHKSLNNSNKW